ncbi:MAG TPA: IS66 family insertion sequence element accessory protein TnpB [Pseudobdellovibrionaceae bacterium]|nr:IS66 family insertion sequence element accessory protein TnpB [Pseudobdellovibrionaceae bacterium]
MDHSGCQVSLKFKTDLRVFVYSEQIDLRAGFERLTSLVQEKMGARIIDGDLFVFFGRSRTRVKLICYDGTGVVLITKRLERGRFMNLFDIEEREITTEELDLLLRGGIVRRPLFGKIPLTNLPRGIEDREPNGTNRERNQHRSSSCCESVAQGSS